MGKNAAFTLTGWKGLDRALAKLPRSLGRAAVRRALKKAARPIAEDMARRVPVRTGRLRDSIGVGTKLTPRQGSLHKKFGRTKGSVEIFVGAGEPYAHLVEFGTSKHAARPFARPAWDSKKDGILPGLIPDIRLELAKAASRLAKKNAAR